ncbi:SWIB-domain-containing protein [Coemansia reversa NRRL 1564]|uniref:SWIB-domain-containing protein n=1 Tax=Coemansia reversa (strain ATCC 12441 / NRRL 1564) TaxID=763665 RepID=A0A2G5B1A1_COERN|nr:SWIB-domain-containing protein [Coemansia reversa NRRL 1564]|eukprot:PIA12795.1 SWIB-domain-containing protein [Coemansia reversa NRRL 1564]
MDVQSLTPRIRQILQQSDLSTVSAKKVRRQLENEMSTSLDTHKADIDDIIKMQFQQLHNESQQRHHAQQQYVQQYSQQGGMGGVYGASQAMPGLQVPGGGYPGGMHPGAPGMPHGGPAGMIPGAGGDMMPPDANIPRKRGRPRKPENEKKLQRKKRIQDPNRPKRQTGLSKPMKLSETLSEFLEQKYCARTDVVKNLWKYIKANELQDPSDKRYILCDERLQKLFHTERLYMYTMNKLLNEHLVKPTPEENLEAITLLNLPPSHPAAADSAGLIAATSPKTGSSSMTPSAVAPASPAVSDTGVSAASDALQTGESENDDEDRSVGHSAVPNVPPQTTSPLALPPQPSGINGGSSASNA